MSYHPYLNLPPHCFWRQAVAEPAPGEVDPVVRAKFTVARTDKIVTAGSCFAQHISRHLAANGFTYLVTETAHPIVQAQAESYGYGLFSARYGNVYTALQLLQLLQRAYGELTPFDDAWERADGRVFDPYRPRIQPRGFASMREYRADRAQHFAAVRRAVETMDVLVFTLGLTETWINAVDGVAYPLCPGTAAGAFETRHRFVNFGVDDVAADLRAAFDFIAEKNPRARVILTVSPVPLIATASGQSVIGASAYSKAVLLVAAQTVAAEYASAAYFPSYEIVTGPASRGAYFADDLRSVTEAGVSHVMRLFMRHYAEGAAVTAPAEDADAAEAASHRQRMEAVIAVICDEEALARPDG